MSAEILRFEEFAGSGRGLIAGPVLPQNVLALSSNIDTITYDVYNLTDGGAPVSGALVVADVMYAAAQPWSRDSRGYTFLWPAPGSLWPLANKRYRIVVTFTTILAAPYLGRSFIEAWEVTTKSPST